MARTPNGPSTAASQGNGNRDQAQRGGEVQTRPSEADEWSSMWMPAEPGDASENPWAWAHRQQTAPAQIEVSRAEVTAVLVTLDAARWLPDTLNALAVLQDRPSRLIAIDNDSADATPALLERARDSGVLDAVYRGERNSGFGAAVESALRQDRAVSRNAGATTILPRVGGSTEPGWPGADNRWLWLLHDDAVPAPDALHQLLVHVLTDRSIDITGPKLLLPVRQRAGHQLSEVGVSISGTGRRELQIEPGEVDQGQRDEPQPRLGVSTCGMLVKRSVWRDLDGLDPAVPIFRDGVEFGWRAHLNGYRIVTTPAARMIHRQVGRAGLRPRGLSGRHPAAVDRLLGMTVVAGHAPGKLLPLVWLRLVWSCLLHAGGYLFGKVPGRSMDELSALVAFVRHPRRLRELRARTASIDPAPGTAEVVRALRPPRWSSLQSAGEAISSVAADAYRSVAGEADAASLDELTGDDFSSVSDETPRNAWLSPVLLIVAVTVIASLLAARSLFGTGSLAGPALLPPQHTLGSLWRSVVDPIAGAPSQTPPPWLALTAVAATLFLGQPEWLVTVALCGVVPLSILAAYPVLRRVIGDRRVRLWVAVTYALLPVLLGGENQGRLALSVFAFGLPLLVVAVRALALRRPRTPEAWRGGWGAGVVLVVLLAFEPSLIGLVLVLAGVGALALRRSPRKISRIGIAVGLPVVVLLPWVPSLITAPGRLFVGPDSGLDGVPSAPLAWHLLLGRPVGPGLPPLALSAAVFGTVWLVALLGLARRPRRRTVLAAWTTALLSFACAAALSRLVVSVPPVGTEVRPWAGAYVLIGFAALLLAGGVGVDGLAAEIRGRSFSWLQPATVLSGVVLALVAVTGAAWWVWAGAQGPVAQTRLDALPPYVRNAMRTGERPRVLAVDLSGGIARYFVVADDQVRLGAADRGFAFGGSRDARQQLDGLVVRLVAGTADSDIAPQLSALGVGYVWVRGANEDEQSRIDNTPGLGAASGNELGTVWQLEPATSRATLSDGTTTVPVGPSPTTLPAGPAGRQLRIGEAADPRWRAELGGQPLPPTGSGWQQAFVLPAGGGPLTYTLVSYASWFLPAQGLVLLVAIVLAAPAIRRPEVRDPTRTARRAATLSEVA